MRHITDRPFPYEPQLNRHWRYFETFHDGLENTDGDPFRVWSVYQESDRAEVTLIYAPPWWPDRPYSLNRLGFFTTKERHDNHTIYRSIIKF